MPETATAATAEDIALGYYIQQQTLSRSTAEVVQTAWRELDYLALMESWSAPGGPGDTIVDTVVAAQLTAAGSADRYIDMIVTTEGASSTWDGHPDPAAFSGQASDGRPLTTLLTQPLWTTSALVDAGMPGQDAMDRGLAQLIRMVVSETADAGRGATGVGIVSNRRTVGYTRMLSPPSCQRCVILAGRVYGSMNAFKRHPRCDCVHMPSTVMNPNSGRLTNARAYWDSLTEDERNTTFGAGGAQAIRDGASITATVNARRSPYTASAGRLSVRATRDGITRRSWFYHTEQRLAEAQGHGPFHVRGNEDGLPSFQLRTPRLLPEEIYKQAGFDREKAVALLTRHGYIRPQ